MLRVTLAARLALIGLVGFILVSTVVVAIFYRTTLRENELTRLEEERRDTLLRRADLDRILREAVSHHGATGRDGETEGPSGQP